MDYSLTFSNELANLFTTNSAPSVEMETVSASYVSYAGAQLYLESLYGSMLNIPQSKNPFYYNYTTVLGQFRRDKFSIYIPSLPIKSYKNTSDKNRGGTRKEILANVPAPFQGADIAIGKNGTIVGSYGASLGVVNRLSNQTTTTNNFDVEIRDMETDEPAEQLTKSIINFTISAE